MGVGKTAPNAERTISRRKLFKYGTVIRTFVPGPRM
jgi:hypothetical protein